MKIGQVTFYRPINYGAVLQAYALQKVLDEKLNCDVELIDYRQKRTEYYRQLVRIKEYPPMIKHPYKLLRRVGGDVRYFSSRLRQRKGFDKFIKEKLAVSEKQFHDEKELAVGANQYDAYIVGSDLVWNPDMTEGLNPFFFLNFVKDVQKVRISYAASIGTELIDNSYIAQYQELLKNIRNVSVREHSAHNLLSPLTDKKIEVVLDPSLLTEKKDWQKDFVNTRISGKRYIISFALEPSKKLVDTVCTIADREKLPIVHFELRPDYGKRQVISAFDAAPDEFLSLINNAEFVVTNSFHGCAFSILFHKNLWCVPHTTRGIRMVELLNSVGLNDRILYDNRSVDNSDIEYTKVDNALARLRGESMNFLTKALGVNDEIM